MVGPTKSAVVLVRGAPAWLSVREMPSPHELLAWIEAFRPTPAQEWNVLDAYVEALPVDALGLEDVPQLLRVFARFPRHDGHGVFWAILHTVERVAKRAGLDAYAAVVLREVERAPTEMGVRLLERLVGAGVTHVGPVELAPAIAELARRAPIVDYTLAPAELAAPGTVHPRVTTAARGPDAGHPGVPTAARATASAPSLASGRVTAGPAMVSGGDATAIIAAIAAFAPAVADEVDWAPLLALLAELEAIGAPLAATIDTLLATLDRFRTYPGFAAFWRIVTAIESTPDYASALVASLQRARTDSGVTLVLRALANGITHAAGVELAPFAASLLPPPAPHAH